TRRNPEKPAKAGPSARSKGYRLPNFSDGGRCHLLGTRLRLRGNKGLFRSTTLRQEQIGGSMWLRSPHPHVREGTNLTQVLANGAPAALARTQPTDLAKHCGTEAGRRSLKPPPAVDAAKWFFQRSPRWPANEVATLPWCLAAYAHK